MKYTPIAVAALALSLHAGIVHGQDENRERPEGPRQHRAAGEEGPRERSPGRMIPLIRVLDTNQDGTVDSGEIAKMNASLLALDVDEDGKITREEVRRSREGRRLQGEARRNRGERARPDRARGREDGPRRDGAPPRRETRHPLVRALDVNRSGILEAEEIANAPETLSKLDANGDGELTGAELRPQRPARGEGPRRRDRAARPDRSPRQ